MYVSIYVCTCRYECTYLQYSLPKHAPIEFTVLNLFPIFKWKSIQTIRTSKYRELFDTSH